MTADPGAVPQRQTERWTIYICSKCREQRKSATDWHCREQKRSMSVAVPILEFEVVPARLADQLAEALEYLADEFNYDRTADNLMSIVADPPWEIAAEALRAFREGAGQ